MTGLSDMKPHAHRPVCPSAFSTTCVVSLIDSACLDCYYIVPTTIEICYVSTHWRSRCSLPQSPRPTDQPPVRSCPFVIPALQVHMSESPVSMSVPVPVSVSSVSLSLSSPPLVARYRRLQVSHAPRPPLAPALVPVRPSVLTPSAIHTDT